MSKPLVIVESPTKVRTVKKYLGNDFNIAATVGHIKDLPNKEMGIDIENGFKPKYRTIPGKPFGVPLPRCDLVRVASVLNVHRATVHGAAKTPGRQPA